MLKSLKTGLLRAVASQWRFPPIRHCEERSDKAIQTLSALFYISYFPRTPMCKVGGQENQDVEKSQTKIHFLEYWICQSFFVASLRRIPRFLKKVPSEGTDNWHIHIWIESVESVSCQFICQTYFQCIISSSLAVYVAILETQVSEERLTLSEHD